MAIERKVVNPEKQPLEMMLLRSTLYLGPLQALVRKPDPICFLKVLMLVLVQFHIS